MIIWLASYPRSGNTFFRLLLKQVYGIYSHDLYGLDVPPDEYSVSSALNVMVWPAPSLAEIATAPQYEIIKTHEKAADDDYPAICLIRDGRDALVSYVHFIFDYVYHTPPEQQADLFAETLRPLIETDDHFGGWGPNVQSWLQRRGGKTVILKYEDVIQQPEACLRQAMREIGWLPAEIDSFSTSSFAELHEQFPQFFRRGQVGAWREELPDDLHDLFWQRCGEAMLAAGYARD